MDEVSSFFARSQRRTFVVCGREEEEKGGVRLCIGERRVDKRGDAGREKKRQAREFVPTVDDNIGMHASLPLSLRLSCLRKGGENANKATSKRPKLRGKNKNVGRRTKPHSGLPGRRTKRLGARRTLGSRLRSPCSVLVWLLFVRPHPRHSSVGVFSSSSHSISYPSNLRGIPPCL